MWVFLNTLGVSVSSPITFIVFIANECKLVDRFMFCVKSDCLCGVRLPMLFLRNVMIYNYADN